MNQDKDGGQAFPHGDPTHGGDTGMSLRDYFAAHAMVACIRRFGIMDEPANAVVAEQAYQVADAMLIERAK